MYRARPTLTETNYPLIIDIAKKDVEAALKASDFATARKRAEYILANMDNLPRSMDSQCARWGEMKTASLPDIQAKFCAWLVEYEGGRMKQPIEQPQRNTPLTYRILKSLGYTPGAKLER